MEGRGTPLSGRPRGGKVVRAVFVAIVALVCLAGCNALPPGEPAALRAAGPTSVAAAPPVVLLRGWRDLWSDGIDRLADALRAANVPAAVFKENQSREVGDALVAAAAADELRGPVVIVGFSYGADDSIRNARRLNDVGRAVDLLVLIDPVTPDAIPPNVRRCVNLYQSNGAWDVFPWLRGVPVKDDPARRGVHPPAENIDLRLRPDLLEPDTSHKTIAGNPKVHAAIVAEVREVVRSR